MSRTSHVINKSYSKVISHSIYKIILANEQLVRKQWCMSITYNIYDDFQVKPLNISIKWIIVSCDKHQKEWYLVGSLNENQVLIFNRNVHFIFSRAANSLTTAMNIVGILSFSFSREEPQSVLIRGLKNFSIQVNEPTCR